MMIHKFHLIVLKYKIKTKKSIKNKIKINQLSKSLKFFKVSKEVLKLLNN